jgi:hypothetical protein
MADLNNRGVSPRMRQDLAENTELPERNASTGRMFIGYCLTAASPAISWVLSDLGMIESSARIIALAVLVAGALLVSVGSMARWGYNNSGDHHVFGV